MASLFLTKASRTWEEKSLYTENGANKPDTNMLNNELRSPSLIMHKNQFKMESKLI